MNWYGDILMNYIVPFVLHLVSLVSSKMQTSRLSKDTEWNHTLGKAKGLT